MKTSAAGFPGSAGSYRITEKNSVATISAAEAQLVGCPLPASVVARIEWIRSRVARFPRAATSSALGVVVVIIHP
jgi:hypothetical protein